MKPSEPSWEEAYGCQVINKYLFGLGTILNGKNMD